MRVLGYLDDRIVIHDLARGTLRKLKDSDLRAATLVGMAGLQWLTEKFPGGGSQGFSQLQTIDWLHRLAIRRGHFDDAQILGRGASKVAGRIIFHAGDRLIDGSTERGLADLDAGVFLRGVRLPGPAKEAATAAEGAAVLKIANGFNWDDQTSGLLLTGWCALAPLCGALTWRPHLWITGGAGSGKTTLLNEFVLPLMNGGELFFQGDSTEAGVRQKLREDALPVIMDEGEPSHEREAARLQGILTLLRQSSSETGARTLRGTAAHQAVDFRIRSVACIASIQVSLQNQADLDRFCLLELKSAEARTGDDVAWQRQLDALASLRGDLSGRLQRRMLDGWGRLDKSLTPFRQACLKAFGSTRYADQYGVLLAGAWVLSNDGVASSDDVRRFMGLLDWSGRRPDPAADDAKQAWAALLHARLWFGGREQSVFDAIRTVVEGLAKGTSLDAAPEADTVLRSHGIIVRLQPEAVLHIARLPKVGALLADTPYRTMPARLFERLPGAYRGPTTQTFAGVPARATVVPLSLIQGLLSPEA